MNDALRALPNIGPKLSEQLRAAGIDTPEALRETGAKEAWLRILAMDPSACINRLQSMESAVRGIPKAQLPKEVREDLSAFVRQAKA